VACFALHAAAANVKNVFNGKGNKGKTKEQQVREAIAENPDATVIEIAENADCDESYVRRIQKKMEKEKQKELEKESNAA
jgi:hypothetical protein